MFDQDKGQRRVSAIGNVVECEKDIFLLRDMRVFRKLYRGRGSQDGFNGVGAVTAPGSRHMSQWPAGQTELGVPTGQGTPARWRQLE